MCPCSRTLILISTLVLVIVSVTVRADDGSRRLIKNLFFMDSLAARPLYHPVQNSGDKVAVQVGLALVNIRNVNFDQDSLTSMVWIITEWNDPSLRWKPVNYGNIEQISVPVSMIWSPDLAIFNELTAHYAAPKPTPGQTSGLVTVDYNGKVLWIAAPRSLESHCDLEPKSAVHECGIRIGSWTHTSTLVDFQAIPMTLPMRNNKTASVSVGVDTTPYLSGKRWTIESSSVETRAVSYQWMSTSTSGPDAPVTELEFKIRFTETRLGSKGGACGA